MPQNDNHEEDPADIFDSSLSTLFNIAPIALSSDRDGFVTYTSPQGDVLKLELPSPPAELHRTLQANHLWLSGIYLSDLICNEEIPVRDKRVAELGAGAGLPGIMACRHGANVVSTDWGVPEVLDVLHRNFERNTKQVPGAGKSDVQGHQWGSDPSNVLNALQDGTDYARFDALLLADTLWVSDAHGVLLDSIESLLRPEGTVYIVAGLHTGRGPIDRFCNSAAHRQFEIEHVREAKWQSNGLWEECHGKADGLEEERGVVIYLKLRRITVS